MLIGVNETHVSPNGSVYVIKKEDVDPLMLFGGCHKAKELDASFLGDSYRVNAKFHSRDDHNFYE